MTQQSREEAREAGAEEAREPDGHEPEPFPFLTEGRLIGRVVERLRCGRSQRKLAQAAEVSPSFWSRAESGDLSFGPEQRATLARGLGLTPAQLEDEIARERTAYLRWLEAHQSQRPESASLVAAIEQLRCSTIKSGIDRIASGMKQLVDTYYAAALERIRAAAEAEKVPE